MKNNIVYVVEKETNIADKTIIYKGTIVKETLLHSIISDLITFSTILFSFWVNYMFIHSRALSVFLLITFLIGISVCSTKRKIDLNEYKKIIDDFISEAEKN